MRVVKPLGYIFYFSIVFGSFQSINKGFMVLSVFPLLLQAKGFLLITLM